LSIIIPREVILTCQRVIIASVKLPTEGRLDVKWHGRHFASGRIVISAPPGGIKAQQRLPKVFDMTW